MANFAIVRRLVELRMPNNSFGSSGINTILSALQHSRSLEVLSLRNCGDLTEATYAALTEFVHTTQSVRELDFEQCPPWNLDPHVHAPVIAVLEAALERNCTIELAGFRLLPPPLHALFLRSRDARSACREAALCRRELRLPKPIAGIISRLIWSTRGRWCLG